MPSFAFLRSTIVFACLSVAACSAGPAPSIEDGTTPGDGTQTPAPPSGTTTDPNDPPPGDPGRDASVAADGGSKSDAGAEAGRDAGCVRQCTGKQCGPDGCGGSCGTCSNGTCNAAGRCSCTPSCTGKSCGDDGCGGSCGICTQGTCNSFYFCGGAQCGNTTCGSYAACCHCNGQPICFALQPGGKCSDLGAGCN